MKPLDDIFVVDLSRILSGPICTMLMGDMGADRHQCCGAGPDGNEWRLRADLDADRVWRQSEHADQSGAGVAAVHLDVPAHRADPPGGELLFALQHRGGARALHRLRALRGAIRARGAVRRAGELLVQPALDLVHLVSRR